MSKYPRFSLAINIGSSNEERVAAFELYQKAFNARKLSESTPPDGSDLHIAMEINGFDILLGPGGEKGSENMVTCQIQYDNENDLRQAYDILTQEGQDYSIGSFPWATVGALVTDKFGVRWWLYTYS